MRSPSTDRKEGETTSRLCAAESKVGSCCVPSEGGRPRLGVVKSATSATESDQSVRKHDHLQGVYRTSDSVFSSNSTAVNPALALDRQNGAMASSDAESLHLP
jgi:hypothetical protein